jgi:hypothetical protein
VRGLDCTLEAEAGVKSNPMTISMPCRIYAHR